MDNGKLVDQAVRVTAIRSEILNEQPFFGRLLMKLNLGFDDCETAYTDMENIVFDPDFCSRLDDTQLRFIMLHELMHCVLKHCVRSNGKIPRIYNIACDIVVNSMLLEEMMADEIIIDGYPAMNKAPDGKDGRLYTADEVYDMLMKKADEAASKMGIKVQGDGKGGSKSKSKGEEGDAESDTQGEEKDGSGNDGDGGEYAQIDSHDQWKNLGVDPSLLEDKWNSAINDAFKKTVKEAGNLPAGMTRVFKEVQRESNVDWKYTLRSYIVNDSYDYDFNRPDRRYVYDDLILPSFECNDESGRVEKLWFPIDTSGSISNEELNEFFFEIQDAIRQVGSISGCISFFDCDITEPEYFDDETDLMKIVPKGGGGTSFRVIFKKLREFFPDELPKAIIILTDGFATFPKESEALGVDVIWVITGSNIKAPWGNTININ